MQQRQTTDAINIQSIITTKYHFCKFNRISNAYKLQVNRVLCLAKVKIQTKLKVPDSAYRIQVKALSLTLFLVFRMCVNSCIATIALEQNSCNRVYLRIAPNCGHRKPNHITTNPYRFSESCGGHFLWGMVCFRFGYLGDALRRNKILI